MALSSLLVALAWVAPVTASPADSVRLELRVPREVPSGRPVPVRLELVNPGSAPATLYLRGREIAFDVVVTRPDGSPVWRRLAGAAIPAILQVRRLAPGERMSFEARWAQRTDAGRPVAPGDYLVKGALLTDQEPLETEPAPLRILPRR